MNLSSWATSSKTWLVTWFTVVFLAVVFSIQTLGSGAWERVPTLATGPRLTSIVVARKALALLDKPALDAKELDRIPYGSSVDGNTVRSEVTEPIDGMPPEFQKVVWNGQEGYVYAAYLVAVTFHPVSGVPNPEGLFKNLLVDGQGELPWLKLSDPWVIASQVWGWGRKDDQTDMPHQNTPLRQGASFVEAPVVQGTKYSYALRYLRKDQPWLLAVKPASVGCSIWLGPERSSRAQSPSATSVSDPSTEEYKDTLPSPSDLYRGPSVDSEVIQKLPFGQKYRILQQKKVPLGNGYLLQAVTLTYSLTSETFAPGTKVKIVARTGDTTTVYLREDDPKTMTEVASSWLSSTDETWTEVETPLGLQGWLGPRSKD